MQETKLTKHQSHRFGQHRRLRFPPSPLPSDHHDPRPPIAMRWTRVQSMAMQTAGLPRDLMNGVTQIAQLVHRSRWRFVKRTSSVFDFLNGQEVQ